LLHPATEWKQMKIRKGSKIEADVNFYIKSQNMRIQ